jgi:hypothetical protein
MMRFLPDTPAALIENITGEVHDVEGINDRPRAGTSSAAALIKPVNPSITSTSIFSRRV